MGGIAKQDSLDAGLCPGPSPFRVAHEDNKEQADSKFLSSADGTLLINNS